MPILQIFSNADKGKIPNAFERGTVYVHIMPILHSHISPSTYPTLVWRGEGRCVRAGCPDKCILALYDSDDASDLRALILPRSLCEATAIPLAYSFSRGLVAVVSGILPVEIIFEVADDDNADANPANTERNVR